MISLHEKKMKFCSIHIKDVFLLWLYIQILFIMSTGKVKFFNERKGFGFIQDDATQQDVFVHVSGLVDKIRENDQVTFEVTEDNRGKKAINVRRG